MRVTQDTRAELRTAVLVVLGVLAAAPLTGLAWRLLTPLPRLRLADVGVVIVDVGSETAVASDGWFAVCAATAGLVCALVVFARIRRTALGSLLGLVVGGLLAAVVAWRLGVALGPESVHAAIKGHETGFVFEGPLELSSKGVLFAWPLASIVAYFALTAGLTPPEPKGAVAEGAQRPQAGMRFPITVLRPGYAIDEVDRFFTRLEAGESDGQAEAGVRFSSTRLRRGYDEAAVDAALETRVADRSTSAPQARPTD